MTVGADVDRALGRMERQWVNRDWSSPANVTALAGELARQAGKNAIFGNGLLARQLGVNIRTVQRWQAPEGKQQRGVTERSRAKRREPLRALAARQAAGAVAGQIARRGLRISIVGAEVIDPSGNSRVRPPIQTTARPDEPSMPALLSVLRQPEERSLGIAFQGVFFDAWMNRSGEDGWGLMETEQLSLSLPD